ncbi:MAG: radical SAM protein [Pseudomonadota bacterium]
MGALFRVPAHDFERLRPILEPARAKNRPCAEPFVLDETDPVAVALRRQGFIVGAHIDERARALKLIEAERDYGRHYIFLPHEDCNFRCTYCYEKFLRGKMTPEIVDAVKDLAAREIPDLPLLNVGWFGGEPCLALDVIGTLSEHFLTLCAAHDTKYRASITTNGYFLSKETVDDLLRWGIGHFQVTVDGSEEAHDTVRKLRGGQATYRRIFDNLLKMAERDDAFSVAVRVNFNPLTISTIEDFLDEAQEKLAPDQRFFLDFHAVGRWGGPNDAHMDVVQEQTAMQAKLGLIAQARCKGFSAASLVDALKPHGAACYAGKPQSLVIGSDGQLYKCTVAFEDPRNQIGHLRAGGVLEIDEQKFKAWTEPVSVSGKCGSCSFAAACQSRACPLATIEASEPPCPFEPEDFETMVNFVAGAHRGNDTPQRKGGRRYETVAPVAH